jgi:transposase
MISSCFLMRKVISYRQKNRPHKEKKMENIRITLENETRRELEKILGQAENKGDLRGAKRIMAIFAVSEGMTPEIIALTLGVIRKTVMKWVRIFLSEGPPGLISRKSPGRKPKLAKSQKKELSEIISKGPAKAGFPGACWRSPMIRALIFDKFGVFYAVNYISQLLGNMGFSYQKARFVPSEADRTARREWLKTTWPDILRTAEEKDAMILSETRHLFPNGEHSLIHGQKKDISPLSEHPASGKHTKFSVSSNIFQDASSSWDMRAGLIPSLTRYF